MLVYDVKYCAPSGYLELCLEHCWPPTSLVTGWWLKFMIKMESIIKWNIQGGLLQTRWVWLPANKLQDKGKWTCSEVLYL